MKLKVLLLLSTVLLGHIEILAQNKRVFLFEKFVIATIHFKNKGITRASCNYDAANGKLMFMQDGTMMELENVAAIDSICFGPRTLLVYDSRFMEKYEKGDFKVLINWKLRDSYVGTKGAYGMVTHGKVEQLRFHDFGDGYSPSTNDQQHNVQPAHSNDIYKRQCSNQYTILQNNSRQEIRDLKQLYKKFPNKKDELQQFIKTNHLDWSNAADALSILEQAFTSNDQPQ